MREKDYQLGEKVRYSQVLEKVNGSLAFSTIEICGEGILTGFRTATEMRFDYEDGYCVYDSHRVALVTTHLYRSPKKIPVRNFFESNPR